MSYYKFAVMPPRLGGVRLREGYFGNRRVATLARLPTGTNLYLLIIPYNSVPCLRNTVILAEMEHCGASYTPPYIYTYAHI